MRKTRPEQWKKGRGVSLTPKLWARVEAVAEAQEKGISEVIGECLEVHLPVVRDLTKTVDISTETKTGGAW